jgi:hypothetical protein
MATAMVSSSIQALHLRIDSSGVVAQCNPVAKPLLEALGCRIGGKAAPALLALAEQARQQGATAGRVPFGSSRLDVVAVSADSRCDIYGSAQSVDPDPLRVTWDNPNPVLRVDRSSGQVLYANPAAEPLLKSWGVITGDRLPQAWVSALRQVRPGDKRELVAGGGYGVTICPQADKTTVHLYGRKLA